MAVLGHSGSQAPQLIHSLVIIVAIQQSLPVESGSGQREGRIAKEHGQRKSQAEGRSCTPARDVTVLLPTVNSPVRAGFSRDRRRESLAKSGGNGDNTDRSLGSVARGGASWQAKRV